jgi:oligopeptide/dipeptide ABC transporter ATP-binding protein
MLDLRAERGLTYLFITHDLSLAWVIADRIAVMYLGKIMEIGPAEQVIRDPHNPYTRRSCRFAVARSAERRRARRRTILVGETPDAAHIPSGCRFHPACPYAFDRCASRSRRCSTSAGSAGGVLAGGGRPQAAGARRGDARPDAGGGDHDGRGARGRGAVRARGGRCGVRRERERRPGLMGFDPADVTATEAAGRSACGGRRLPPRGAGPRRR